MAPGERTKEVRHVGKAVPLALALVLAMGAVAFADNTAADGDGVVPIAESNPVQFGEICLNELSTKTVLLAAQRNGRNYPSSQVWANSEAVTFSVLGSAGSGLSASVPSSPDDQVTLPGDWKDKANNFRVGTVTATASLTPTSTGAFAGTITFRGSGGGSNGGTLNIDNTINVTAEVVECSPTNTAPVADAGGPYSGDEGSAITIDGSGSADPDGDVLTYAWSYTAVSGTVCEFDDASAVSTTITCSDNGSVNVQLTVDDGEFSDDATTGLTLDNVAPTKEATSFSFNPYTGAASASVGFADLGWTDVVSATWSGITGTGTNPHGPRTPNTGTDPLTGTFAAAQTYSGCVANAVSVQVSDDDLEGFSHQFAAANTLGTYSVAWMAPIKDGARNIVSQKNVLPLKITIVDSCTGLLVTDRTLQVRLQSGIQNPADVAEGTSVASESVSSADSGNIMRLADGHYQYNQTTKNLSLTVPYTIVIKDVTGGLTWTNGQTVATAVIDVKK